MSEPDFVELGPDWSAANDVPLKPANHFATQLGGPAGPRQVPDGIFLYVANAAPPMFPSMPDQARRAVAEMRGLYPIEVSARYVMSRERTMELIEVLQTAVKQYDEQLERAGVRYE